MSGSTYPDNQENLNPNNLSTLSSLNVSSLSELEEMIKGAHPLSMSSSSGVSSQSDLMQKLKALQLIEQMISTQERLLSGRHDHRDIKQSEQESHLALSRVGNGASPLRPSTQQHSQQGMAEYTLPSYLSPPLKAGGADGAFACDTDTNGRGGPSVSGDCTGEVSDLSRSEGVCGGTAGRSQVNGRHQRDEVEGEGPGESQAAASRPSLKEKREEQLRLLNEKIAQRHSKLPRRTGLTGKTGQASSSSSDGTSKKTSCSTRKPVSSKPKSAGSKARASGKTGPKKTKGPAKVAGKASLSSKSAPSLRGSKSITSSTGTPPSHTPLPRDPPSQAPPTPHPLPSISKSSNQSTASPQLRHQSPQIRSLHLSERSTHGPSDDIVPLESLSYSQLVESEETTAAANSSDLLDSTSYLIPVEGEERDGDDTLVADVSAVTDGDVGTVHGSSSSPDIKRADVTCEEDSLASTLTQAYGFSTTSDFLSSLASPHKEQCGSSEEPSAISTVKSNVGLSAVQEASLFLPPDPSTTASASTMTVDRAATVIQDAWYVFRHLRKAACD